MHNMHKCAHAATLRIKVIPQHCHGGNGTGVLVHTPSRLYDPYN